MASHRFAVLTEQGESGATSAEFKALFADDVIIDSPFLTRPLQDKALTIRFIVEVFARVGYPRYTHQFTDDQGTTLFLWDGKIQAPDGRIFTLEGSLGITEGDDGLIHRVISYLRPLQVGALITKEMVASAASALPEEYWKATRSTDAK